MRKISVALLLAAAACGSSDSTTPTASGVFPAEGFTGRTLRVEISGDATTWKDGATVDLGAGVTVNSVDVASPTDLFADITIDPTAAAGKNDVTVTSSGKKYTLAKAFELVSPLAITFQGDVAQYGVPNFTIENLDFDSPFDITTDATGAFSNLAIMSPAGTEFTIGAATQYEITGQVFIDANGMSGPVSIVSGPSGGANNITSAGGTITVTPRTPTPFTGTATGNFADLGSSAVYGVTASGSSIIHYTLTASDQTAQPASAILGAGGTWRNDVLGAGHLLAPAGNYSIVAVNLGGMGYTYTLTGAVETVTAAPEGTDATNGTSLGALVATALPFEQTGGKMTSATSDQDWIKFTVDAAHANKRVEVVTDQGTDLNTDTAVEVTNCQTGGSKVSYTGGVQDGTLCNDFFGCQPGDNLTEDVVSDPLPAGTYCVEISAGALWASTDQNYLAVLWLE